jgi:hypothetical protein
MKDQSMEINPWKINPWKINPWESIHENQSMRINPWKINPWEINPWEINPWKFNPWKINPWIYPWEVQKKPLSGLLSNIFVFFDFLDEFFHEDQWVRKV